MRSKTSNYFLCDKCKVNLREGVEYTSFAPSSSTYIFSKLFFKLLSCYFFKSSIRILTELTKKTYTLFEVSADNLNTSKKLKIDRYA